MTQSEITRYRKEYATEDANLATAEGYLIITDTKYGTISISFENGCYEVFSKESELLKIAYKKDYLESWLMTVYTVEDYFL